MTRRSLSQPGRPRACDMLADLRAHGFSIVRDVLAQNTIATLDTEIAERFVATPFCQGGFYGGRTKRFGRLLARVPSARRLVEHPTILAVARALLEPHCDKIQLSVMQAIEVHPGEIAQVPHRDQDMWQGPKGDHEYMLNVMWPLTPFRSDNGATMIWPDTHGARALMDAPETPTRIAPCDPGDAILFLGSTLHGAGANLSVLPRRGIVVGYCLGWLKPYENPWLAYPPAIARQFSPDLASLIGYRQDRPNLGNVDGQCPSRFLETSFDDRLETHVPAIDALTPDQTAMVAEHVARERARVELPGR